MGSILEGIDTGDNFLNITLVAQTLWEIVNKCNFLKLRSFCKGHRQQDKMTAYRMGKDLYHPHIGHRVDLEKMQRTQEIGHQNNKSSKKWGTDLNRELSTVKSKMAKRYLRKCSISLAIRET